MEVHHFIILDRLYSCSFDGGQHKVCCVHPAQTCGPLNELFLVRSGPIVLRLTEPVYQLILEQVGGESFESPSQFQGWSATEHLC